MVVGEVEGSPLSRAPRIWWKLVEGNYLYDHPAGDKEDLGEGMGSRVV